MNALRPAQDPARPRHAAGRPAWAASWAAFETALGTERARLFLWLPVLVGLGIGLYFALPTEPPRLAGAGIVAAAASLLWARRRHAPARLLGLGLLALALGFAAAQWRTQQVAAPVLSRPLGPVTLEGRVVEVLDLAAGGQRVVLDRLKVERLAQGETPARVRLVARARGAPMRPGERVRLLATLLPPPAPVAPGAFDFARQLWFERIGATGYTLRGAELLVAREASGPLDRATIALARLRHDLARQIRGGLPQPQGAVAAALMTGDRGEVPDWVFAALRDSGLAHMLAISGLHMGLFAGLVFFLVRAGLALVEPVALRWPIKKWAAAAALLAAFLYLLLSGASIPTRRAFIMTALVLGAVMLDRPAISMRLVAVAALAVLLPRPESLLQAGFQMSFAAVVALIATYEALRARALARERRRGAWVGRGIGRRMLAYFGGLALSSLVAGLATAPYAAFAFNRFAAFSLLANLAAMPVFALWIMPWSVLALALVPFGAEGLALAPMGAGIEILLAIARAVAGWPGAVIGVPAAPSAALVLVTLGGLWLCLWRRRWRLAGLGAIAAGLALALMAQRPDVLVDGEGKLVAMRGSDGALILSSGRPARFAAEVWRRRNGELGPARLARTSEEAACDALGCVFAPPGRPRVAFATDARALDDDCRRADIVISAVPVGRCPAARLVIDRFDLWRGGAHALWFEEDGTIRLRNVAAARGARPWTAAHQPRARLSTGGATRRSGPAP